MTQQDRTPAGAHRFSDVVAVARVPVGAGPAVTIVMITAMSRAPARPAGKPSSVHRRADALVAFGRESVSRRNRSAGLPCSLVPVPLHVITH